MEHIKQQLASKYKHLRTKDAEILNALVQEASDNQLVRAAATKTYNPTTISLLYWILPLFWIFNRSFTEQRVSAILQFALALSIFPGHYFYLKLGWMARSMDETTPDHQVAFLLGWGTALIILTLWFFYDGFTIGSRIRKANFKRLQKALK